MKIFLLGDSITEGIGSKKINFEEDLLKKFNNNEHIINLAKTGTTIEYASTVLKNHIEDHSLVVILCGNVDAQIRPNRNGMIYRRLPKRFQSGNGSMILPRPFYSHALKKRIIQHIENYFRTLFRKTIYLIDGTEQWVSLERYMNVMEYINKVVKEYCSNLIICSTVYIDGNLFPDSNREYESFNSAMKFFAEKNGIPFVDLYTLLMSDVKQNGWDNAYNKDHFHPNRTGYCIIAEAIYHTMENL